MVTQQEVDKMLKRLNFDYHGWGRAEVKELPNILVPSEEIYELVNGIYEGGFALLLATNIRLLLIDKKPLNYLTVEDFRFDMINEIDYSHRLIGARITVSTGSKTLIFRSYNQPKLRKLIGHVQHCMAESKQKQSEHQEDQKLNLEQINQQLQAYLIAQHKQQEQLQAQLKRVQELAKKGKKADLEIPPPVKPAPELADFLFAQSLLAKHQTDQLEDGDQKQIPAVASQSDDTDDVKPAASEAVESIEQTQVNDEPASYIPETSSQMSDLYAEGMKEVFGKHPGVTLLPGAQAPEAQVVSHAAPASEKTSGLSMSKIPQVLPLDVNPITIAYSKLPMALRNRKFGRPSFHAHSQASTAKA